VNTLSSSRIVGAMKQVGRDAERPTAEALFETYSLQVFTDSVLAFTK